MTSSIDNKQYKQIENNARIAKLIYEALLTFIKNDGLILITLLFSIDLIIFIIKTSSNEFYEFAKNKYNSKIHSLRIGRNARSVIRKTTNKPIELNQNVSSIYKKLEITNNKTNNKTQKRGVLSRFARGFSKGVSKISRRFTSHRT
jgi:hypothetical protein